jgi:hypothetical protein
VLDIKVGCWYLHGSLKTKGVFEDYANYQPVGSKG